MTEVEEQLGIEQRLERAICSRHQHFRDQASSMTMESVRRLLEKDMDLGKFALDEHKGLVRQYFDKVMEITGDAQSTVELNDVDKDGTHGLPKALGVKNNPKKSTTLYEEKTEDSPIHETLTSKSETVLQGSSLSESGIEKALWERADYFCANSEKITMAGVRRLLEEDLGLDKGTLDPFKKFISQKIDVVLGSPEASKFSKDIKKHASENLKHKKTEKINKEKGSDSSDNDGDELVDKVKPRKETTSRRKNQNSEMQKKRKLPEERDLVVSRKKSKKLAKRSNEEAGDSDAEGSLSEDVQSPSSVGKSAQNKETTAAGYSRRVENLKSVIKACGMSVPPSIYKKAKQVPDNERESFLVKELGGILSKEGLSNNPTEKEIKECRKRKQTAKELEGIDTSNIITSSRRRSAFSFETPTPKIQKVGSKNRKSKDKINKDESDSKDKMNKDDNDNSEEKDEGKKKKIQDVKEKKDEEEEEEVEVEDEEEEEEEDDDDDDDGEDDGDDDESEEFNEDGSD